jgi:hypothetical protein
MSEFYSAIKKNKIMLPLGTCMELEVTTSNEKRSSTCCCLAWRSWEVGEGHKSKCEVVMHVEG